MKRLDVLHFGSVGIGDGGRGDLVDALLELVANSAADDEVREVAAVEDVVWRGSERMDMDMTKIVDGDGRENTIKHEPMYWSIVDILLQQNLTNTILRTGC